MEDSSYIANEGKPVSYVVSASLPTELLDRLSDPLRSEIVRWDEGRFRDIEDLRSRAVQMEKTMKWWSDCTANWREKWGKVRAERNRAREQCKVLQLKLESALKDGSFLRCERQELQKEYSRAVQELALVKGVPVSTLEYKSISRASNDIDFTYAPLSEDRAGSEPSLKSELNFIEDVLRKTEEHYTASRPSSVCSESVYMAQHWFSKDDRRLSRASLEDRTSGVDLSRLKQLLEETQRHLQEERNSKIALNQSAEMYTRENSQIKKKMEEYKKQRSDALEEVSRIQLESGDKLARLSLEIEGESETRNEMDRKLKEMRGDIQRLQAENATEWARRERLETEKCGIERENKNLKLQMQDLEETISRRNTNPQSSNEYKTLQADMYERNKELDLLRTNHSLLKKQHNEKTVELEHCQKRLDVLEEDVYNLRKRVEDLKKELLSREDEVDMRNNQLRKLQRTCDELTDHNDTLQSQLSSVETRLRQRTDAMFSPTQRSRMMGDMSDDDVDE